MLVTVKFYGDAKAKYGESVKLYAETLFQLMAGLEYRFGQGFTKYVAENAWHLIDGRRVSRKNDIGSDELKGRKLKSDTFHFMPAVAGASSVLRIVLGIILVIVGYYTGQTWLIQLGAAMALGGVAEMLAPKPAGPGDSSKQPSSFIFNSAPNLNTQGDGKPLVYGRVRRTGAYYISTDFSNDQLIPYYPSAFDVAVQNIKRRWPGFPDPPELPEP